MTAWIMHMNVTRRAVRYEGLEEAGFGGVSAVARGKKRRKRRRLVNLNVSRSGGQES